jgi:hypothetical protein
MVLFDNRLAPFALAGMANCVVSALLMHWVSMMWRRELRKSATMQPQACTWRSVYAQEQIA